MKNIILLSSLFFLFTSCSHQKMATDDHFYDIPMGAKVEELQKEMGPPYAIHQINDEEMEYEYIEKISTGQTEVAPIIETRHYFFRIKKGRVEGKRVESEDRSPFMRNSYDMQTSYND